MLENAGKIAQFSFTYEKVNKTDSSQPSSCKVPLVYVLIFALSACLSVCNNRSPLSVVVVVVVVNFIKHQNKAITGERVAARAAPSYQYAMVLVIIT